VLAQVSWSGTDGAEAIVTPTPGGGWAGHLFLALAPARDFQQLQLDPVPGGGRARSFESSEIAP